MPAGGRGQKYISIHVPLAGNVRHNVRGSLYQCTISIHVPLAGNVPGGARTWTRRANFYPRSPCGERRDHGQDRKVPGRPISIHVPLAGNVVYAHLQRLATPISIHVPLAGNVHSSTNIATGSRSNFYPRSPCGERLCCTYTISAAQQFLSTFPLRGTSPRPAVGAVFPPCISIHVPLAGNVRHGFVVHCCVLYFYPRSPCGERPSPCPAPAVPRLYFYPRSPCGERQLGFDGYNRTQTISIHVPLAGNVRFGFWRKARLSHFYPRSPCGERH